MKTPRDQAAFYLPTWFQNVPWGPSLGGRRGGSWLRGVERWVRKRWVKTCRAPTSFKWGYNSSETHLFSAIRGKLPCHSIYNLAGGFKYSLFFYPDPWEDDPISRKNSCSSSWWQLKYFLFNHPENWGKWSNLTVRIFFQMGWFNHQLVLECWHIWGFFHLPSQGLSTDEIRSPLILLASWWQLKHFLFFTPIPGKMIQFDEHIFQLGWNHQLEIVFLDCWHWNMLVYPPKTKKTYSPEN